MGKRLSALTLAAAVALASAPAAGTLTYAAESTGDIQVQLSGKQLSFDIAPVIEQGTTLVQFRPVFEAMGMKVDWDPATNKVTGDRRGVHIELTLNSATAVVNGETKTLEQSARLIDGFTFVPLRFIGEASEYDVTWTDDTRTVDLKETSVTRVLDIVNDSSLRFVGSDGSVIKDSAAWQGSGKLVNAAGESVYEGDFHNGAIEGQGVLQANNIPFYIGEWKNDRYDGLGKLYADGKLEFEGSFVKGKRQGTGKLYDRDGKLIYEGDFAADKMEGYGKFYQAETGTLVYQGQVKDDEKNGTGKQYYPSGQVYYEGEFKNGRKDGTGKLYTEAGDIVYDGPFKENKQVNSFASYVTDRITKLHSWKKIETTYLTLYYYSDDRTVKAASVKLDSIVDNLYKKLGKHLPKMESGASKTSVYIMPPADFRKDLNLAYDNIVGQWYDTTMFLSLRSDSSSMYQFFQHEMTHAMTIGSADRKAKDIPVWFSEGTATNHEVDPPYTDNSSAREDAMRYFVRKNKLVAWDSIAELDTQSDSQEKLQIGYAQAWSIWSYLSKTYGEETILQVYYQSGKFPDLMKNATGKTLAELEADWVRYVKSRYK